MSKVILKKIKVYPIIKWIYRTVYILGFVLVRPFLRKKFGRPQVVNFDDTLDKVINSQVSVARFGDGELRWALGIPNKNTFQKNDNRLATRLQEVITANQSNLIVCIPDVFDSLSMYTWDNEGSWAKILLPNYGKWLNILSDSTVYYDSNITRPYIQKRDKTRTLSYFNKLKSIWNDQRILIVEGRYTRFGIGNDLLSNTQSVDRIICPAVNAFDKYDEILEKTVEVEKNYDLILLALGPTATIMAYDLADLGTRALDIGHLDVEYEWFLRGVHEKIPIPGKFVNESNSTKFIEDNSSIDQYNSEIIYQVGLGDEED